MSFFSGKFTRRTFYSFFTFCNVVSAILCLYAITSPRWYGAEREAGSTNATMIGLAVSPWYACTRTNRLLWQCEEFVISPLDELEGACPPREESTIQNWTFAIRAMIILTGASAAIAGVLATALSPMGPNSKKGTYILLGFSIFTICVNIVGIIISAVFYSSKLFCDDGLCLLLADGSGQSFECTKKFYHAALVYYIGILAPAASLATSVLLVATHGQVPPAGQLTHKTVDPNEPTGAHQYQYNAQPYATHETEQPQQFEGETELEHVYQPPEGEDWEWDPNSQMYWSEARYMFFRTADGWFYEPNSQQWYDPNTQQWIPDAPQ